MSAARLIQTTVAVAGGECCHFTQFVQIYAFELLLLCIALQKYAAMQSLRNCLQSLLSTSAKLRNWLQHGVQDCTVGTAASREGRTLHSVAMYAMVLYSQRRRQLRVGRLRKRL
jgi:hypothetical protein